MYSDKINVRLPRGLIEALGKLYSDCTNTSEIVRTALEERIKSENKKDSLAELDSCIDEIVDQGEISADDLSIYVKVRTTLRKK